MTRMPGPSCQLTDAILAQGGGKSNLEIPEIIAKKTVEFRLTSYAVFLFQFLRVTEAYRCIPQYDTGTLNVNGEYQDGFISQIAGAHDITLIPAPPEHVSLPGEFVTSAPKRGRLISRIRAHFPD